MKDKSGGERSTEQLLASWMGSVAAVPRSWTQEQPRSCRTGGIRGCSHPSCLGSRLPEHTGQLDKRLSTRQKGSVHPHGRLLCTSSLTCHMLAHN